MHGRAEGDLSKEEEEALRASLAASAATNAAADARLESALQQVDVYEDAFRRIKEATGVADVNEVVQKILSQEDSQHNLMTLTHENQVRRCRCRCARPLAPSPRPPPHTHPRPPPRCRARPVSSNCWSIVRC